VIDHPLDPANSYLAHASVESSERANLYTGNVTLDDNSEAVVTLPDWSKRSTTISDIS
jgi:trimeric autotransporter adhesin